MKIPELKKAVRPTRFSTLLLGTLGMVVAFFAIVFFVAFSFGWIATETPRPDELQRRLLGGSAQVSRLAALEWQRQLIHSQAPSDSQKEGPWNPEPALADSLLRLFLNPGPGLEKDPAYIGALATLLSHARSQPQGLMDALWARFEDSEVPNEAKVFILTALYQLGLSAEDFQKRVLVPHYRHPEPAIRKLVGFGVTKLQGLPLGDPLAPEIQSLLGDQEPDVRWNTSLGLLRLGRKESVAPLKDFLEQLSQIPASGLSEPLLQSSRSIFKEISSRSSWSELEPHLVLIQRIRSSHPSLLLRQAAIEAFRDASRVE